MDILSKETLGVKFDLDLSTEHLDMSNKLFCTFSSRDGYKALVETVINRYEVLYGKVFILECDGLDEVVCTYNVDLFNVNDFLPNTILVHRKKQTNTLYTINALNELIIELNNGILNKNFMINWNDYKNCIMLTKDNNLQIIRTSLLEIVTI